MTINDNNTPESRPAGTEQQEPRAFRLGRSRDGRTYDPRTGLAWSKTSTRRQENAQ